MNLYVSIAEWSAKPGISPKSMVYYLQLNIASPAPLERKAEYIMGIKGRMLTNESGMRQGGRLVRPARRNLCTYSACRR